MPDAVFLYISSSPAGIVSSRLEIPVVLPSDAVDRRPVQTVDQSPARPRDRAPTSGRRHLCRLRVAAAAVDVDQRDRRGGRRQRQRAALRPTALQRLRRRGYAARGHHSTGVRRPWARMRLLGLH